MHYFAAHPTETLAVGSILANARDFEGALRVAATERGRSLRELRSFPADGQAAGEFRDFDPAIALRAAPEATEVNGIVEGHAARRLWGCD